MTTLSHLFAALPLTVVATGVPAQTPITPTAPNASLSVVGLTTGMCKVRAEVATTLQTREIGLIFRRAVFDTADVLFVFDESAGHCFRMRNTDLPLPIAFIIDNGTISDITETKPQTEGSHCPTRTGSYALEMNKGWFARKGVRPGMRIGGLPR